MKLSNKEISKFLKELTIQHPIQSGMRVQLHMCPYGIEDASGAKLHGSACPNKQDNLAVVHIDTSRSATLVYSTIAHEYRHVMQWENKGLIMEGNKEDDANLFGNRFTKKYLGYPGAV